MQASHWGIVYNFWEELGIPSKIKGTMTIFKFEVWVVLCKIPSLGVTMKNTQNPRYLT
jgi:hypothetical protein